MVVRLVVSGLLLLVDDEATRSLTVLAPSVVSATGEQAHPHAVWLAYPSVSRADGCSWSAVDTTKFDKRGDERLCWHRAEEKDISIRGVREVTTKNASIDYTMREFRSIEHILRLGPREESAADCDGVRDSDCISSRLSGFSYQEKWSCGIAGKVRRFDLIDEWEYYVEQFDFGGPRTLANIGVYEITASVESRVIVELVDRATSHREEINLAPHSGSAVEILFTNSPYIANESAFSGVGHHLAVYSGIAGSLAQQSSSSESWGGGVEIFRRFIVKKGNDPCSSALLAGSCTTLKYHNCSNAPMLRSKDVDGPPICPCSRVVLRGQ
jgi:hypothetical protein